MYLGFHCSTCMLLSVIWDVYSIETDSKCYVNVCMIEIDS